MTLFFIVAALTLLLIPPTSMLFIPFLVMAVLYKAATRAQEIGYSEQEIVFSGLVPRKIKWSSLNNVLLKDGILTMDYKDNRLFQKETEDDPEDDDEDATEEESTPFACSSWADRIQQGYTYLCTHYVSIVFRRERKNFRG